MNLSDGGAPPRQHPTTRVDAEGVEPAQSFEVVVDGENVQKCLRTAARERGYEVKLRTKTEELRAFMESQSDFKAERNFIQTIIESRGHICQFYPKYHCELSPIEPYWGAAKRFAR